MRRTGWLTVLGAAAAGTLLASRARSPRRLVASRRRREAPPVPTADRTGPDVELPLHDEPTAPPLPAEPSSPAPEGSTGAVTIVPVAMERTSAPALPGPEQNGSSPAVSGNGGTTVRRRAVGPLELPPPKRPSAATLTGLAAAAAVAAVALGAAGVVSGLAADEEGSEAAAAQARRAVALLSKPSTERAPLRGSERRALLAVGSESRGFVVLRGLAPAPSGRAYEAWVVQGAETPQPAALFSGDERLVPLTRRVPPGATVAVTLESEAGSDVPTEPFRFVARRASR